MADVTDADFEQAVIERSAQVPVVVDLWAPWCGPCRTLGPTIEKVVAETNGAVELAKVNVDDNPGIAQAFRVQSIPAVFALRDRQVVDSFIGALPEHQVREFVSRLAPSASEADLLAEQGAAAGDEAALRRAMELEPGHERATLALAELLVGAGRPAEALDVLAKLPDTAEVRRIAALARVGDPADRELTAELDQLLDRVKADDEARQRFVDLLEVMGPDDPRTAQYRKALTARLF
ncbi:MAG TPA: tetratricopeptide repeat protein [Acidimicrobiales bacterium]|nr:tetratricopeptide repeat protein [Acidimicrobiales bacterium]